MLRVLIKKQLAEVFKGYFYDSKKNRMRSKWAIAAYFILFFAIMVGFLGGMFTVLSSSICSGLAFLGMEWLYFTLMGGIAIALGAFGSVYNSYSALYLAKDNDLLLSLPIPARTIVASRLVNVYLLGAMYAATAFLPALIVYWITAGATAGHLFGGILALLIVTMIVLLLSCVLGLGVAKISLKLKNRSFITVLASLLFIGGYYFFYFRANNFIRELLLNAEVYGEKIKGAAYGLYLFGRVGTGDWAAAAICTAVTALLCALVWHLISRSFLSLAGGSAGTAKKRYAEKPVRQKTVFRALLGKEFGRFTSSANYMLNCGLGTLLLPAGGVLFLLKGRGIYETLDAVFGGRPGTPAVLLCAMLLMLSSMNNMAVPSVSLEGKNLWIPQSLPVSPGQILRAKASMQLILTGIPMLFASLCAAWASGGSPAVRILLVAVPLAHTAFSALAGLYVGVRMPVLTWTNEVAPIKQSGAVAIVLFGSWGICVALAGLYLLAGYRIGAVPYLLLWAVLFAAGALAVLRWLDNRGSRIFAEL